MGEYLAPFWILQGSTASPQEVNTLNKQLSEFILVTIVVGDWFIVWQLNLIRVGLALGPGIARSLIRRVQSWSFIIITKRVALHHSNVGLFSVISFQRLFGSRPLFPKPIANDLFGLFKNPWEREIALDLGSTQAFEDFAWNHPPPSFRFIVPQNAKFVPCEKKGKMGNQKFYFDIMEYQESWPYSWPFVCIDGE